MFNFSRKPPFALPLSERQLDVIQAHMAKQPEGAQDQGKTHAREFFRKFAPGMSRLILDEEVVAYLLAVSFAEGARHGMLHLLAGQERHKDCTPDHCVCEDGIKS